jgi:FMN phosphatase YigB (HAD superfamily)
MLIGDSLRRDREGARRMGMRFVWIAPPDVQSEQSGQQAVTGLRDLTKFLQ